MKLSDAEKGRRRKVRLNRLGWISWGDTEPFSHHMECYLTDSQWQIFQRKYQLIGLADAFDYAWLRGQFRSDNGVTR